MADKIPADLHDALWAEARATKLRPNHIGPAVAEAVKVFHLRGRHLLPRRGVNQTTTPRQFFIRYAQQRFTMEVL